MSLSRRLVVGLLVLATIGLAILDVVSYAALRSYLSDRVDDQVQNALPLVGRALADDLQDGQGAGFPSPPDGDQNPDGPDLVGPQLPPGTYGELRTADGTVLSHHGFGLTDDNAASRPALPDDIADISPGETITVPAEGGGSDFRVAVSRSPFSTELTVVAVPLTELDETLSHLRTIELIVTLAVLLALAALSIWGVRLGLRPLARIEATARGIAGGDLSGRVEDVDERTEAGRLGIAFNEMLARIERAFAEQRASEERLRRFLADASHELRTPLSSIRGYAELFRLGAAADPDDLARSMSRIESESERMSGLVDDMLTLARLDELREPIRERVDLSLLAEEACADARAAAPKREVSLEAADGAVVVGDPDQLRQLVSNLLRNAVSHAPEGRIGVRVARGPGEVTLEVRDHGPGLPAGSEEIVFERFWRAGAARDRASGGAGLGLAIVSGVALAHGGRVSAENVKDGGARFRVVLPAG
jgi:two-component system, OmpR family, sensor kinase